MSEETPPPDSITAVEPLSTGWAGRIEDRLLALLVVLTALIPCWELLARLFGFNGLPGAPEYLQHLTLWIAFVGAMAAGRYDKHIRIGNLLDRLPGRGRVYARIFSMGVATAICAALTWAGLGLVIHEAPAVPAAWETRVPEFLQNICWDLGLFDDGSLKKIGGVIPSWLAVLVIPLGFIVLAVRFIRQGGDSWKQRSLVALGIPAAALIAIFCGDVSSALLWPLIALLLCAAVLGAPIFVLLGGVALVLFWKDFVPVAGIAVDINRVVTSPVFPTIPIFTLIGFCLSESRASGRLERVFRAWFGWMPGGTAIAATLVCAFFTTFTGASGVTILALGGLLLPVLLKSKLPESFSIGLLTSTGSLGLLLPPSLVVILYAIVAKVEIKDMFLAGMIPGTLLLVPFVGICLWQGRKSGAERTPFDLKTGLRALGGAAWELAIPLVVILLVLTGICVPMEAAAVAAIYVIVIEGLVFRDFTWSAFYGMLVRCGTLVGGLLIILGVAMGLTGYFIDAQVPAMAADWVEVHIHSRWVFLLALNLALILVGCFMDIYSALFVVVPLILPMAQVFGIHPAHLGVIFLANLQLGYLTPPIGMNLFLGSFRFDKPFMTIARYAVPFLLIIAVTVLLITYVPWFSMVLLGGGE